MTLFALRALHHRNFRLFFFGQGISLVGTWMTRIATSWLVYRLTNSGLVLGLVNFANLAPTFLLVPIGGVWADRFERRTLLIATQFLLAVQTLTMSALTLTNRITILEIILLALAQGLINAFEIPSRNSLLTQLVEGHADVSNAVALTYSADNLARLAGPAFAGVAIAAMGEGFCFLFDGLSYLAVILSLFAIKTSLPPTLGQRHQAVLSALTEGWQYVVGSVRIRTILSLFGIVCLIGVPYTVLVPIVASIVLQSGPHTFGFLMGAMGAGAMISGIYLAARRSMEGLENVISASAGLFAGGLIAFSISQTIWLSLALMCVMGFGMMLQFTASNTMIQMLAPEPKRGRVLSYWTLTYAGAVPVGSLGVGAVAQVWGAPKTILLCGLGCLIGAIWFWSVSFRERI